MEQNLANYKQVEGYYDKLWADIDKQGLSGVNSRHRFILKKLKKAGLKRNSRVLEIGCGNGTLTNFISKQIPGGKIVGADISPETIGMAKHKYVKNGGNIEFLVSDMTAFSYPAKFDFVVFPDVLEHIPIEAHSNIFKTIRQNIHDDSVVFINIPEPRASEYLTIHHPELMQIIDQALHTYPFLKALYENGFYLESLETYPVFYEEPDYQAMVVRPMTKVKSMHVKPKWKVIFRNILLRIENLF